LCIEISRGLAKKLDIYIVYWNVGEVRLCIEISRGLAICVHRHCAITRVITHKSHTQSHTNHTRNHTHLLLPTPFLYPPPGMPHYAIRPPSLLPLLFPCCSNRHTQPQIKGATLGARHVVESQCAGIYIVYWDSYAVAKCNANMQVGMGFPARAPPPILRP